MQFQLLGPIVYTRDIYTLLLLRERGTLIRMFNPFCPLSKNNHSIITNHPYQAEAPKLF